MRKLSKCPKGKDEKSRQNLIAQLGKILQIAKDCLCDQGFTFKKNSYYGKTWFDVMEYLTQDSSKLPQDLTRKIFKAYVPSEAVLAVKETNAVLDPKKEDWCEKVRNLFNAKPYEFQYKMPSTSVI